MSEFLELLGWAAVIIALCFGLTHCANETQKREMIQKEFELKNKK
jgi:hypothetical protein